MIFLKDIEGKGILKHSDLLKSCQMNLISFSDATVFYTGICSKSAVWCDAIGEFIIWTEKNKD